MSGHWLATKSRMENSVTTKNSVLAEVVRKGNYANRQLRCRASHSANPGEEGQSGFQSSGITISIKSEHHGEGWRLKTPTQ